MTREDGERALLEFAGFMKEPTVYVVGSQAIYGSFPDLDLGIVLASKDIDVFTVPYYESLGRGRDRRCRDDVTRLTRRRRV